MKRTNVIHDDPAYRAQQIRDVYGYDYYATALPGGLPLPYHPYEPEPVQ